MPVRGTLDELHVHPDPVVKVCDTTFDDLADAKVLADVTHIPVRVTILLDGGARNYMNGPNLGQPRQQVVLEAHGENFCEAIVVAGFVEWQYCNGVRVDIGNGSIGNDRAGIRNPVSDAIDCCHNRERQARNYQIVGRAQCQVYMAAGGGRSNDAAFHNVVAPAQDHSDREAQY